MSQASTQSVSGPSSPDLVPGLAKAATIIAAIDHDLALRTVVELPETDLVPIMRALAQFEPFDLDLQIEILQEFTQLVQRTRSSDAVEINLQDDDSAESEQNLSDVLLQTESLIEQHLSAALACLSTWINQPLETSP